MASFPHFDGTGSVYVCIRKSVWAQASLFRRFKDSSVYAEPRFRRNMENSLQNIRGYTDIFMAYFVVSTSHVTTATHARTGAILHRPYSKQLRQPVQWLTSIRRLIRLQLSHLQSSFVSRYRFCDNPTFVWACEASFTPRIRLRNATQRKKARGTARYRRTSKPRRKA